MYADSLNQGLGQKLPPDFFLNPDTVAVARALLGKRLLALSAEGVLTGGRIVETEAYCGAEDRACHAYGGKRTPRTQTMYSAGGVAYVYLCYGMHKLLNVVTHLENEPHAVLIRAIEPEIGIETMLARRKMAQPRRALTAGPGALTAALAIDMTDNAACLRGDRLWLADDGLTFSPNEILASPRVGVGYAGDHALLPYRFRVAHSPWTSPAK